MRHPLEPQIIISKLFWYKKRLTRPFNSKMQFQKNEVHPEGIKKGRREEIRNMFLQYFFLFKSNASTNDIALVEIIEIEAKIKKFLVPK